MKKFTLVFLGVLIFGTISAQVLVESTQKKSKEASEYVAINELKKDYIRVYVIDKIFGNKLIAELDYGQDRRKKARAYVLANDKSVRKFNSVTEIINLFSANGWEYVTYELEVLTLKRKPSN